MNLKNKCLVSIVALVLLTSLMISVSAAAQVYFYQSKSAGAYTLSGDYKDFGNRLTDMGYAPKELRTGLTTEALRTLGVDILVIPNLGTDLTPEEMAALYQFVMDDGKGVFILGGTPSVNKITTPMGMMVVDDMLEDEVNQVVDKASGQRVTEKTTFSIELPATRTDLAVNSITKGVNTVNVFGVNGIYLFGTAKGVVLAGDTANSPKKLTFPRGSNPPVAAYVKLGKGMVFFISDPDMLVNKNIDASKFRGDNLKLALNAMDWLSTPSTDGLSDDQLDDIIKSLRVEKENMNRTIGTLSATERNLNNQIATLTSDKTSMQAQLAGCQNTKFMGIDYIILAVLFAGGLVAVSLFFAMKKKGGKGKSKKDGGGELGYEFDNKGAGGEFSEEGANSGNEVKEEDIEERLRELEKKGSGQ